MEKKNTISGYFVDADGFVASGHAEAPVDAPDFIPSAEMPCRIADGLCLKANSLRTAIVYAQIHKAAASKPTAQEQIVVLRDNLTSTDYQAIKFAEGEISAQQYEPIRQQRAAWRAEINNLEKSPTNE